MTDIQIDYKKCILEQTNNDYCKDIIELFKLSYSNYDKYKNNIKHIEQFPKQYIDNGNKMIEIINKYDVVKQNYAVNSLELLVDKNTGKTIVQQQQ